MFVGTTGVTRGDSSGRRGEVSVGQEAVPQRRGEQHCIEQPSPAEVFWGEARSLALERV